ncbi:MAG: hypothetical protein O9284_12090 [Steroidobacteraceae bacterium]|jgi:hypothetical protein|nr:hypothetical protein [Steroidobacteraceae bacterium]
MEGALPRWVLEWLASGRLVDLALAVLVLEAAWLALLQRRVLGHAPPVAAWLPNLLAGVALLLALRAALTGATAWVVVWLTAAFAAHLAELARHLRR